MAVQVQHSDTKTLTQVLACAGITHRRSSQPIGDREVFLADEFLGWFDASQLWQLVREFNGCPVEDMAACMVELNRPRLAHVAARKFKQAA